MHLVFNSFLIYFFEKIKINIAFVSSSTNKLVNKRNMSKNTQQQQHRTMVSICTPTYNRRPFIPYLIECVKHQTHPLSQIEWVIVDDGTDPISDLVQHLPFVKYHYVAEKMPLGKKRNLMHSYCSPQSTIIVYMDDDDYYPPERVSHAVEMLDRHPEYLIAGSSEMHMYFGSTKELYQCGPYGPDIATAATFAFRRELLDQTNYGNTDEFSEEPHFLRKEKTNKIPVLQLDPQKTILVISHLHNSLNREHFLQDPEQFLMTKSRFVVADFIASPILVDFYIHTVGLLLTNYDLGKRENKPQLNLPKLEKREAQIQHNTATRLAQKNAEILQSPLYIQMKDALQNKISTMQIKIDELLLAMNIC